MIKLNVNKIWLITDTHLGVRSNNKEWLAMQKNYFETFLMPYLKKNVRKGDVLFHLGDLFENRNSINLFVLNDSITIWEKIADILPVHMLVGNHDLAKKSENDINSLKVFKNTKNITVYEQPVVLNLKDKKRILIMPWQKDEHAEKQCITHNKNVDYLFSHCSFKGISYNSKVKIEDHGNPIKLFKHLDRVISGHIHYKQSVSNIEMLGSPYELTRSDYDNPKGIHLFDPYKNELTFIENTISPKHKKLTLEDILEMTYGEYKNLTNNNYVDVHYNADYILNFPFEDLSNLTPSNRLEFIPKYVKVELENNELFESIEDVDDSFIEDMIMSTIEKTVYPTKIKLYLKKKINSLIDQLGEE